jgi:CRISPR-associated protein Cmr2
MKTYLALTIGPIYKTLSGARKTRELWGGSYLFSYLMEQILEPFKDRDFIVPYIDKTLFDKEKKRAIGLFHDRAIFVAKEGDRDKLDNRIDEILDELAYNSPLDKTFVKNYFQIHPVEVTLEDDTNPILGITPYLNTAELFYRVAPYNESRLKKFLKEDNRYLKSRAFISTEQKRGFPSLPEIALHELLESTDIRDYFAGRFDEEESVYEAVPYKKLMRPYHKYVAIVHADGDNMSKVVESLEKTEDFQAFSKALLEFGREATAAINKFGGTTVFAGGDDLLFFAPVVDNGQTVFELCDVISKIFDAQVKPFNAKIERNATLSFGISVTYYKYPLYEALERSRNQLAKAKVYKT